MGIVEGRRVWVYTDGRSVAGRREKTETDLIEEHEAYQLPKAELKLHEHVCMYVDGP